MAFIILVTNRSPAHTHTTLKLRLEPPGASLSRTDQLSIFEFQGQPLTNPTLSLTQCNAVIFVTTVWKLTQKFSEINPDMKRLKKAR